MQPTEQKNKKMDFDVFYCEINHFSTFENTAHPAIQTCMIYYKKSSLYWRYYDEVCNEWLGLTQPLRAWSTEVRRNVTAVASR